jgi:hypothetical protein
MSECKNDSSIVHSLWYIGRPLIKIGEKKTLVDLYNFKSIFVIIIILLIKQ